MEVSTVFFSFLNFSSFPFDIIEVRIVIDIWESRTETGHFIFKEVKKGWGAAYEVLQKKAIFIVTISLCWYITSKLSVSSCCMIDRFSGPYIFYCSAHQI